MSSPDTRTRILEASRTLVEREGTAVSLKRIADRAGVSRRAIYLHFQTRTELFLSLVAHVDETNELSRRARRVWEADTGRTALEAFVSLNASYNAEIHAIARAIERVREADEAAAAAWHDRMSGRRKACAAIARRLAREGDLAPGWSSASAADLIWALTNLGVWRDLVLDRKWSRLRFERHITRTLTATLLIGDSA